MAESKAAVITDFEEVVDSLVSLERLCQQPLSLPAAQKLAKLNKYIREVVGGFSKRRDALVAEAQAGEGGLERETWREKIEPLLKEEVRIPLDMCVALDDLSDIRVSAGDLERLSYLISGMSL